MSKKQLKFLCATCQRRSYFGNDHFCLNIQAPKYYSIFVTVWKVTFETRVTPRRIPSSVHTVERGECVETGDQGGGAKASILFHVGGVLFAQVHQPWSTKREKDFKIIVLPGENIRFCSPTPMDFIAGIIRRHAETNNMEMVIIIYMFRSQMALIYATYW